MTTTLRVDVGAAMIGVSVVALPDAGAPVYPDQLPSAANRLQVPSISTTPVAIAPFEPR